MVIVLLATVALTLMMAAVSGISSMQQAKAATNGQNGGVALGAGSEANGGGDALNGGQDHPGCNIAIGPQCINQPGR